MYLGSDTAGVTILSAGGVGVFANSNRIDIKGYGAYYGTATAADFVDSYKPTLTTGVQGDSLTYNAATGRFTNSIGVAVLVTMTYSVLASQPPGTRVGRKCLIRKNGVSAAGSEFGFTQTVVSDWSTGSATIRLAPTDYLQVMSEFFGGVAGAAGAYDSYSNITYVLTAAV